MKYRDLTQQDRELVAAASEAIRSNYVEGRHHVGAAVRARSGKIYAGVHMESPGLDVCAEWVALGMAVSAGEREFDCCVAVNRTGVMSPCGVCRELLHSYGPQMDVIVRDGEKLGKVAVTELLPLPYAKAGPPTGA